jgi:excisionase family DNA binding protein
MAQAYYTLDEAAKILALSSDALKQLARKGQIRSFQDRGTWRFRVQDIQELARQRGLGSDPELLLGESAAPKPADSPPPRSPVKTREAEVFDFSTDLDDEHVGVGHERLGGPTGSGRRSDGKKSPKSPPPKAGSDSDVRLVKDANLPPVPAGSDSDIKLVQDPPAPRPEKVAPPAKGSPISPSPRSPRPDQKPKSGVKAPDAVDSGVRLVPLDSDSDVKIVGADSDDVALGQQPPRSATDSDIRLERPRTPPTSSEEGMLTEEINLDEELQKGGGLLQEQAASLRKSKPPSSGPEMPISSPFELSEADLSLPAPAALPEPAASKDLEVTNDDSSSDFDLTPAGESSSPIEPSSDEDFTLQVPDDADVALGELADEADLKGPSSGISIENPADSGISLEQGGEGSDEIEFELSLDGEATPKPAAATDDSDSEFELSLDADSDSGPAAEVDSDSSEFELTLDDTGGLAPLEEEAGAAAEDKDIFETDFEVPALEEESGSQAVALEESVETDLESSDFDLTTGSDDEIAVDESGSDVVAVDEEGAEVAVDEEPAFDQLTGEVSEEAEEEEEPAVYEKAAPTAPWGALPVIFLLPCVIVLFLVGVMGFELVQSMVAHKPPGMVTRLIGGVLGQNLKQ